MAVNPIGRTIALTFDDLPVVSMTEGDLEARRSTTAKLLAALAAENIHAVGFVNECQLDSGGAPDERQVALLRQWLDAGHELGNHTYSHADLHLVSAATFERDVLRGERVLRPLLAERGAVPRYFRHPYLHTGRSLETRDAVVRFLGEHGYDVAPVTVAVEDFWFAAAHDWSLRRGDAAGEARVVHAYRRYLERTLEHCEMLSMRLWGREIPQVLLLHANRLNAHMLPDITARMRQRGYSFTTLEQALRDPAYASPDTYVGAKSVGWLERWGSSRGLGPETITRASEVPGSVRRLARAPLRVRLSRWAVPARELLYARVKRPLREWWRAIR